MSHAHYSLLVVEDSPGDVLLLQEILAEAAPGAFRLAHAGTVAHARALLAGVPYDAVLLDLTLPDSAGLATLAAVQGCAAGVPVVVLTGLDDERVALEAVHRGAQDYLVKGQVFGTMLARTIRHAIERARTEQSAREAEDRFRRLADDVSGVFWLASVQDARLLFLNPAFEALTGLSREAAYADPRVCLELVHPGDRPRIQARLAALPDRWDDEYRIVRADGQVRWVRDRGYLVRSPLGEATRLTGMVEDVTEARAAREKIRLQASLLDAVGEAVIATDMAGVVFYWNRAAEQLYGWTAAEAEGRSIVDLVVPELARGQGEEVMARLAAGETWQGEFPVRRRDGTCFPALVTDAPIHDAEGRLIGVVGVSSDVTARRRAEQALREGEARYRALFETMAQGVVLFGEDGRVLAANPAALEIMGLQEEQLLGRDPREVGLRMVDEEGRPLPTEAVPAAEAWRTGRPAQRVMGVFNEREGRYRWILASARPHAPAEGGAPGQVFSTFADITAQREAQAEVRRAHHNLDAILNTTPLATVVVDRQGTVRLWNPAAERMFGWRADEVVGGPYPLEPVDDAPPPLAIFEDAWDGTCWNGAPVRRRARDGRVLDLNLWNAPLTGPGGDVVGLVGVLADVSERKALEEQFLQAQKMEAMGRLAGGVAHDFNNLLTAVTGHCELLLEDAREGTETHADLMEIRNAAVRAASLTRQLLAFSRKQVIQPRVLDLNTVVGETQRMLQRLIGEDVELVVALNAGRATVRADRGQLEQVLVNLAVNARDAMPRGGVLTLTTDTVVITPEQAQRHPRQVQPGDYVRLSVSDTGAGMPEHVLARVFEPFFTTKEAGRGTGLGLSTVYGIVEQSGGYVWAESRPGEGSTFRVYLPAVREPVARGGGGGPDGGDDSGSETVLLVEDESAVRALAARILNSRGYRVLHASDGVEALEVLARGLPVDLILTDVVLSRVSGPELVERARAQGRAVPAVLFMSGYTDQALASHGILDAEIDLIEKPFSPAQLARRVRRALDRAHPAAAGRE